MSEYIKYQKSKILYAWQRKDLMDLISMTRMLLLLKRYYLINWDGKSILDTDIQKHFILHLGLSTCLWKLLKTNNEKTSDSNLIFRSPSVVLAPTES